MHNLQKLILFIFIQLALAGRTTNNRLRPKGGEGQKFETPTDSGEYRNRRSGRQQDTQSKEPTVAKEYSPKSFHSRAARRAHEWPENSCPEDVGEMQAQFADNKNTNPYTYISPISAASWDVQPRRRDNYRSYEHTKPQKSQSIGDREGGFGYVPLIYQEDNQKKVRSGAIAAMEYAFRSPYTKTIPKSTSCNNPSKPQNTRRSDIWRAWPHSSPPEGLEERPDAMDYTVERSASKPGVMPMPTYANMRSVDSESLSCADSNTDDTIFSEGVDTTPMTTPRSVKTTPSTYQSSWTRPGKSSSSSSSAQGMYHAERSQLTQISSYESPKEPSRLPPSKHVNGSAYPYSNLREAKSSLREHPYFTKTGGDYKDLITVKDVRTGVSTVRGRAFQKGRSNRPEEQKWI